MTTFLFLKLFVVSLVVFVFVYNFLPIVSESCNDKWDAVSSIMKDKEYHIPEDKRKPSISISEWEKNKSQFRRDEYLKTKLKYEKTETNTGSVFSDGHHTTIPDDKYMWRDGMVQESQHV